MLLAQCDQYVRLPAALRSRFEAQVVRFAADHRVTGVETDVHDEVRLFVAASAVTLTVGWPEFRWAKLTEVLVYPSDFGSDYSFDDPELAGRTHPWGIVLLSVPSLRKSFAEPHDGYHVGIHEFAHLLDLAGGEFDGVPVGMKPDRIPTWLDLVERERRRVWRTRHALRSYGAMSPAEFLAVGAEAFFENPQDVRRRHPELYGLLAEYFQQDPAAWDDAREMDAHRSQTPSAGQSDGDVARAPGDDKRAMARAPQGPVIG